MGMFDYATVSGAAFVCSEGHDLSDEEFQTKDFDCVLGYVHVSEDGVEFAAGCMEHAPHAGVYTGSFDIYADCRQCPAFVQAETFNVCPCPIEFRVTMVDGRIVDIRRTSSPTADWLAATPGERHMGGCRGPMSHDVAQSRRSARAFFPWDPVPCVTDEQAEAQRRWEEEIKAMRAKRRIR